MSSKAIITLIEQLNNLAEQRKYLLDKLWVMEEETERLRIKLMKLLSDKDENGKNT